jgi:hypothetical protein
MAGDALSGRDSSMATAASNPVPLPYTPDRGAAKFAGGRLMRTAAELLEKAEAFEALAASAKDDLLRATYLDIAKNYRELAQLRAQRDARS